MTFQPLRPLLPWCPFVRRVLLDIVCILVGLSATTVLACPLGYDDDETWQCAQGIGEDGQPIWDQDCLNALEGDDTDGMMTESDYAASQDGAKCDEYWGGEDSSGNFVPGTWDKLTGKAGEEYWQCYGAGKTDLAKQHPPGALEEWPESQWLAERFKIDKRCVPDALCTVEHTAYGWCSDYYVKEIMPACGPDPYRERFCTEICPPSLRDAEGVRPLEKQAEQVFFEYHLPYGVAWKHEFNSQLMQHLKQVGIAAKQFRDDLLIVRDAQGVEVPRDGDLDEHRFPLHVQYGSREVNEGDRHGYSPSPATKASARHGPLGWADAYKGKCPVKKVGFVVADQATEVATKVVNWVRSILPALLAAPEPVDATANVSEASSDNGIESPIEDDTMEQELSKERLTSPQAPFNKNMIGGRFSDL